MCFGSKSDEVQNPLNALGSQCSERRTNCLSAIETRNSMNGHPQKDTIPFARLSQDARYYFVIPVSSIARGAFPMPYGQCQQRRRDPQKTEIDRRQERLRLVRYINGIAEFNRRVEQCRNYWPLLHVHEHNAFIYNRVIYMCRICIILTSIYSHICMSK